MKKISLNKETLRILTAQEAGQAAGGVYYYPTGRGNTTAPCDTEISCHMACGGGPCGTTGGTGGGGGGGGGNKTATNCNGHAC